MRLQKFVYRGLLTGLPNLTYNAIRKNTFVAPFSVQEGSTYINFELDEERRALISKYLEKYDDDFHNKFEFVPISIIDSETPKYYLSINYYTCTSPMFLNDEKMTRCEVNTYVQNKDGKMGTLILDYTSNQLSMDPVNIFKSGKVCNLNFHETHSNMTTYSEKFLLESKLGKKKMKKLRLDPHLIKMTDIIFYKNGIYDKMHYNSQLTSPSVYGIYPYGEITKDDFSISFNYLDTRPWIPEHVFHFQNEISFTASLWENVFSMVEE